MRRFDSFSGNGYFLKNSWVTSVTTLDFIRTWQSEVANKIVCKLKNLKILGPIVLLCKITSLKDKKREQLNFTDSECEETSIKAGILHERH